MILYHFTAPYREGHLGAILRDGMIATTESNVSRTHPNAGPPVVWLTDNPAPPMRGGDVIHGLSPLKTLGRIAVEVPDAMRWRSFCVRHRVKPAWRARLASVGGAESWWVALRPIPVREFTAVERLDGQEWARVSGTDELPSLKELLAATATVETPMPPEALASL